MSRWLEEQQEYRRNARRLWVGAVVTGVVGAVAFVGVGLAVAFGLGVSR